MAPDAKLFELQKSYRLFWKAEISLIYVIVQVNWNTPRKKLFFWLGSAPAHLAWLKPTSKITIGYYKGNVNMFTPFWNSHICAPKIK